eukprot:1194175-Prorocentrum_minimum.AAC.5
MDLGSDACARAVTGTGGPVKTTSTSERYPLRRKHPPRRGDRRNVRPPLICTVGRMKASRMRSIGSCDRRVFEDRILRPACVWGSDPAADVCLGIGSCGRRVFGDRILRPAC